MKKNYIIILGGLLLVIAGLFYISRNNKNNNPPPVHAQLSDYKTDAGFMFSYLSGPGGYVVREITPPKNADNFIRSIVLMRYEDSIKEMPVGGEGPPTISISVFKNTKKQQPRAWADEHQQYSNINLKTSDVTETVVGGANAIGYMADGLYASENIVVAHGENVYVISGMFLDVDSSLRKDFAPLVESIRFTSQAGQE